MGFSYAIELSREQDAGGAEAFMWARGLRGVSYIPVYPISLRDPFSIMVLLSCELILI